MNRILIDFKENHRGEMVGTLKLPKENTFTLEALAEVIEIFSRECKIPPKEVLTDIGKLIK